MKAEWFLSARSLCLSFVTAFPYLVGKGEHRKEVTEEYPDPVSSRSPDELPPRSRGLLSNDIERCTGCGDCVPVCPTSCIRLESEDFGRPIRPGHPVRRWVSTYDIDLSRCIFCGLCVSVCQPESLIHTKEFEAATDSVSKMIRRFGRGPRPAQERREHVREIPRGLGRVE